MKLTTGHPTLAFGPQGLMSAAPLGLGSFTDALKVAHPFAPLMEPKILKQERKERVALQQMQYEEQRRQAEADRHAREVKRLQGLIDDQRAQIERAMAQIGQAEAAVDGRVTQWLAQAEETVRRYDAVQAEIGQLVADGAAISQQATGLYADPSSLEQMAALSADLGVLRSELVRKQVEAQRVAQQAAQVAQAGERLTQMQQIEAARAFQPVPTVPFSTQSANPLDPVFRLTTQGSLLGVPPRAPAPAGLGLSPFQSLWDKLVRPEKSAARDAKDERLRAFESQLLARRQVIQQETTGSLAKVAGWTVVGVGLVLAAGKWIGGRR